MPHFDCGVLILLREFLFCLNFNIVSNLKYWQILLLFFIIITKFCFSFVILMRERKFNDQFFIVSFSFLNKIRMSTTDVLVFKHDIFFQIKKFPLFSFKIYTFLIQLSFDVLEQNKRSHCKPEQKEIFNINKNILLKWSRETKIEIDLLWKKYVDLQKPSKHRSRIV